MPVFTEDEYYEFEEIKHYGILRRSGRYPWGSGGNNLSEAKDFRSALDAARFDKNGNKLSLAAIAKALGMSTSELNANITMSDIIIKQDRINQAERLKKTNMSNSAIAREMGINESSVRGLLEPGANRKKEQLESVADVIRKRVGESKGYIDVGKGIEHALNIAKSKLDLVLNMLRSEGYAVETVMVPTSSGNETRTRVIAKPGENWSSINFNRHNIEPLMAFSPDGGTPPKMWQEPLQLNPSRFDVVYGKKGEQNDGMIYVRPGVEDLSMGSASYAQVRIAVGDKHYIKGMAVLKDDLPPGVDVMLHSPKPDTGNKMDVLKAVKGGEPIERFGAMYSQITDPVTGKLKSHINIVNNDEDWDKWSKSLATQMLSKQKPDFVKRQLDVTLAQKKAQLEEIMALTNPTVKKELLKAYASDMDASSVHLKAAALPRQKTHVILPANSLKDTEVYAPGYKEGEKVVLIRYPHGGKFEIPELTVNNSNREARSIIPTDSRNAIAINANVAKTLSGADFDGDTVVVIPNNRRNIQTESPLTKLKSFEPHEEYRGKDPKTGETLPGVKLLRNTQSEMGKISNLITDMTILGADHDEIARAVKHSMVIIDAEKHGLDYLRSSRENGINALKKKYQPGKYSGASTIISRTSGPVTIDKVKLRPASEGGSVDPKTGEPIYVPTGNTKPRPVKNSAGEVVGWERVPETAKVQRGSRLPGTYVRDPNTGEKIPVRDAYDLVSGSANTPKNVRGTVVERHYADYSNSVRSLANQARKADLNTPEPRVNKAAKETYSREVTSLKAKLKAAQANSPRERAAQAAANVIVRMKKEENPNMTAEEVKRVNTHAIRTTRERMGAKPQHITITDREWEAIQNHAVPSSTLREILTKTNTDHVRQLAQPKTKLLMQPHNVSLAKSLLSNGYTREEVAARLGVSVSTLDRSMT